MVLARDLTFRDRLRKASRGNKARPQGARPAAGKPVRRAAARGPWRRLCSLRCQSYKAGGLCQTRVDRSFLPSPFVTAPAGKVSVAAAVH